MCRHQNIRRAILSSILGRKRLSRLSRLPKRTPAIVSAPCGGKRFVPRHILALHGDPNHIPLGPPYRGILPSRSEHAFATIHSGGSPPLTEPLGTVTPFGNARECVPLGKPLGSPRIVMVCSVRNRSGKRPRTVAPFGSWSSADGNAAERGSGSSRGYLCRPSGSSRAG